MPARERIPRVAQCLDAVERFQLLAQPAHDDVDRAGVELGLVPAKPVEDVVAAEHLLQARAQSIASSSNSVPVRPRPSRRGAAPGGARGRSPGRRTRGAAAATRRAPARGRGAGWSGCGWSRPRAARRASADSRRRRVRGRPRGPSLRRARSASRSGCRFPCGSRGRARSRPSRAASRPGSLRRRSTRAALPSLRSGGSRCRARSRSGGSRWRAAPRGGRRRRSSGCGAWGHVNDAARWSLPPRGARTGQVSDPSLPGRFGACRRRPRDLAFAAHAAAGRQG